MGHFGDVSPQSITTRKFLTEFATVSMDSQAPAGMGKGGGALAPFGKVIK